jgi:hypothetical protein
MCSDGVERTKQELFEMMPLLRFEDWQLVHTPDGYRWRQRVQG